MKHVIFLGLGGFLGTLARYGMVVMLAKTSKTFPFSIVLVNVLGCLIIGILTGWLLLKNHTPLYRWGTIGFCGGFTTFSSFALDSYHLLQKQDYALFFLYFALSTSLGLGMCILGIWIGKILN